VSDNDRRLGDHDAEGGTLGREEREGSGDEPYERRRWFRSTREDAEGNMPAGLYLRGSQTKRRLETRERGRRSPLERRGFEEGEGGEPPPIPPGGAGSVNWTPLGPSVIARGQASGQPAVVGQINGLAVGPGGVRVYAGGANGGLWYSSNTGASWRPLDDFSVSPSFTSGLRTDSLAVGAVSVLFGSTTPADSSTDLVYVGTGDANIAGDTYFGIGIKRSASGGAPGTWTLEATNLASAGIFRIVIDHNLSSRVIAATSAGLFRRPTAAPYTSWTQVTSPAFTSAGGSASDVIIAGSGSTKQYYAAFGGDTVYSSPDGTNGSWTALTGIPAGAGRIALAAGESDPSVVYALASSGNLYRLVGTAFQLVAALPPVFFGGQGTYDIVLAVDPSNANVVYLGGDITWDAVNGEWNLAFFRGTISGAPGSYNFGFTNTLNPHLDPTWIGRGVHGDSHSFAFARNATNTGHDASSVWVGTDGGVFQSSSSGSAGSFASRNAGLAVAEITYFAHRYDTDAVMIAGLQDNGTSRFWGEPAWFESPRGDGGGVAIDPNDQYRMLRQYVQAGRWTGPTLAQFQAGLYSCTDGGASGTWSALNFPPIPAGASTAVKTLANTENSTTTFYGRIAVSPQGVAPTLAAFGTNRLWLTADWGATWVTLPTATNPYTTPATAAAPLAQDQLGGLVRDAVFASGSRIYAATSSQVFRFDRTGATWTQTTLPTAGLPVAPNITSIAVENPATGSIYVVLGGSGHDHIYYFNGASWATAAGTTLSQAALDVPVHGVAIDPANTSIVYVGSDVGCWRGQKSGGTPPAWTWTGYSQGLPESAITNLAVHAPTRLLRASLYGRGMWEIEVDAASSLDTELYLRVNYADDGRIRSGARFPFVEGAQDPTRKGYNVFHWQSPDIKSRRPTLPNPHALGTPPNYLDFAVNIDDYVDTQNVETVDETGVNRIVVQVHNRGRLAVPGNQVRVLLLVTDAYAGLPPLPSNYAARINAGDTTNWVSGSQWRFADPMSPYRSPATDVDARNPGVVFYDFDFSTMGLPAGHNHVCAAAFVTTTSAADQITGTTSSMDTLTMQDRHAAHRNLHLVAAAATPIPPGPSYQSIPATALLRLAASEDREAPVELVLSRGHFEGTCAIVLSKASVDLERVRGFDLASRNELDEPLASYLFRWEEALEKNLRSLIEGLSRLRERDEDEAALRARISDLRSLDFGTVFVSRPEHVRDDQAAIPMWIDPASTVAAAITLVAPEGAVPGNVYRLDLYQRQRKRILGGSTYAFVVTERRD
jgi:hypothetical protein